MPTAHPSAPDDGSGRDVGDGEKTLGEPALSADKLAADRLAADRLAADKPDSDSGDPGSDSGDPGSDPFAGLVLDEAFIAGAARYEAPARTRAAIARFGPIEDQRTPLRAPRPRRRFWARAAPPRTGRPRVSQPWVDGALAGRSGEGTAEASTRGRIIFAVISVALLGSVVYGLVRSELGVGDAPQTALPAVDPPSPGAVPPSPGDELEDQYPDLNRWDWQRGHCYRWPQTSTAVSVADVPCAEPHLFEAIGPLDLSPAYPDEAPLPAPSRWGEIGERHCEQLITSYLGYPLDPFGRFVVSVIRPDRTGWERGDRKIICGLGAGSESDVSADAPWTMTTFSGAVRGVDQAVTYPVDTCLRKGEDGLDRRVPCEESHRVQSLGTVTLPDVDGAPPSDERFDELAEAACAPLLEPYLDHGDGTMWVRGGWYHIRPESWRAGTRTTTCTVGFADQSGNPVEKTGLLNPADTTSV